MSIRRPIIAVPVLRTVKGAIGILSAVAVVMLTSLAARETIAHPAFTTFNADISGYFAVSGANGESPLFVVKESGAGYEPMLGGFTYTTDLLHNLARIPDGCGPDSSTGVGGFGVMTFADGQMWLHRISGSACFSFPAIVLDEQWRIAGGTGAYEDATGKLVRTYEGDVRTSMGVGSFFGTVKL